MDPVTHGASFSPQNLELVILSFEGPDQPYSMAGGLGVRVAELSQALAAQGYTTHLIFIGDPRLPGPGGARGGAPDPAPLGPVDLAVPPRRRLRRARKGKLGDFNDSVPPFVLDQIIRPAASQGKVVAVLAEEWHTAEATCRLSDLLHWFGLAPAAPCCCGTPTTTSPSTASTGAG